ncbi:MAG TPA: hypothetical protein P5301_09210 [Bacteroidales bacterium]|nr:hypothetical protein [Bacteroidales bacterium]HRR53627.1 hypothetical protein [Bacteroidales bacterium]
MNASLYLLALIKALANDKDEAVMCLKHKKYHYPEMKYIGLN